MLGNSYGKIHVNKYYVLEHLLTFLWKLQIFSND